MCGTIRDRGRRHARQPQDRDDRVRRPQARHSMSGEPPTPEALARRHDPLLRRDAGRARARTAGRSRSSSATRSWPSSGSPSATRTMRCGPCARPPTCRRPCRPSTRPSASSAASELRNHIGVNTGEVIATGDATLDQRLVTGDAVNTAARLEQAAGAHEIILGELTHRLARDAGRGRADRAADPQGQGRAGPGLSPRRVETRPFESRRRPSTPFVGREAELGRLDDALAGAATDRRAQLITVISATPASASHGSSGSSSTGAGGDARSFAAGACRTATASRSGRSPRSCGRRRHRRGRRRAGRAAQERIARLLGDEDAGETRPRSSIGSARRWACHRDRTRSPSCSGRSASCWRRWRASDRWSRSWTTSTLRRPTFLDLLDHLLEAAVEAPILLWPRPVTSCARPTRNGRRAHMAT